MLCSQLLLFSSLCFRGTSEGGKRVGCQLSNRIVSIYLFDQRRSFHSHRHLPNFLNSGLLIAALGLRLNDGYTELDVAGELGVEKRGEARLLVGTCKSPGLLVVHGRRDATFPEDAQGMCRCCAYHSNIRRPQKPHGRIVGNSYK